MSRRRRRRLLKPTVKRTTRRRRRDDLNIEIDAGVAREIWGVIYLAIAILTFLTLRGALGSVGIYWKNILAPFLGYGIYVLPVILGGMGIILIVSKDTYFGFIKMFGLTLLMTSLLGTIHLSVPEVELYSAAADGRFGGIVGFVASFLALSVFGKTGSYVVFLALFIISLLLTFEISLGNLVIFFLPGRKAKRTWKKDAVREERLSDLPIEDRKELEIIKPEFAKNEEEVDLREVPLLEGEIEMPEENTKPEKVHDFKTEPVVYKWNFPSLDLLSNASLSINTNDALLKENAKLIKSKLQQFGIEVEMHEVHVGPTVMQYTLRPHAGIKLSKITTLKNDLALALAAKAIRIEAPIPGKSLVGIEIPNETRSTVHLREILESSDFANNKSDLKIPVGRDVSGKPVIDGLSKMPHLLVAGATGSGKSVCINAILLSFFYQYSPRELKLILIDPKRVELNNYNSIPHLLTPVITDPEKAAIALRWAVKEMTRRYQVFAEAKHRNIDDYNGDKKIKDKLPKIVVVVDELADLMMIAGKEVEASICRIAQMARAVGIHLIIATQRPSVDVVTGLIKANIPARIAFTMTSQIDSRTVLDMMGAEDLLGHGDMLYLPGNMSKPIRVQGVFVSSKEIERVTNDLKLQIQPEYNEEIIANEVAAEEVQGLPTSNLGTAGANDEDNLYEDALRLVMESKKASASLLQRRLSVGYARAARLLDLMEQNGVIGPSNGAKAREIYLGKE